MVVRKALLPANANEQGLCIFILCHIGAPALPQRQQQQQNDNQRPTATNSNQPQPTTTTPPHTRTPSSSPHPHQEKLRRPSRLFMNPEKIPKSSSNSYVNHDLPFQLFQRSTRIQKVSDHFRRDPREVVTRELDGTWLHLLGNRWFRLSSIQAHSALTTQTTSGDIWRVCFFSCKQKGNYAMSNTSQKPSLHSESVARFHHAPKLHSVPSPSQD